MRFREVGCGIWHLAWWRDNTRSASSAGTARCTAAAQLLLRDTAARSDARRTNTQARRDLRRKADDERQKRISMLLQESQAVAELVACAWANWECAGSRF